MRIFGISFDTTEDNRRFAEKFKYTFPLLCDVDRKIGMAYGACDGPSAQYARRISYLIDFTGPEAKIERAYEKVDPRNHPAQVLEALGS